MNLKSERWVLGKDYTAAPTCASAEDRSKIDDSYKERHGQTKVQ